MGKNNKFAKSPGQCDGCDCLTWWMWNYLVWGQVLATVAGCWGMGGFGIIFDDDNGIFIKKCLNTVGGGLLAGFPIYYLNPYSSTAWK